MLNLGDVPQTKKRVKVVDHLTGTAVYNTDEHKLHVQAESSDKTMPMTDLSVAGFTPTPLSAAGAATVDTDAPESTVKVVSERGGSVVIPVQVQGSGLPAVELKANAGGEQTVERGVTVELDGSASTGNIDTFEWTGPDGVTLTGEDTAKASFTAPDTPGDYQFTLKVTGPDGTSGNTTTETDTVVVHVRATTDALAKIAFSNSVVAPNGAIDVPQNESITLDGGQSTSAAAFSWSQVSGPTVNLGATNRSTLTFTVPKTGSNIVLRLDVRNPDAVGGTCTDVTCDSTQITLRPVADSLAITTARYVANSLRWRVDGTASSTNRNRVQVYSGLALNPAMLIGAADVLADGTWSVDARDSSIPLTTCQCVTVVSDRGGQVVNFPLEKPQNLPPATADPGQPPVQTLRSAAPVTALAAAVPLAGNTLAAARIGAPATVAAGTVGSSGVPVTVSVPTGATLLRLRVLTTANKALFSTFKAVKGGTKVKVNIRSAKLRKQLRSGKRYVIEVRAGTARNRLGKPTRKVLRIR